jgi:hypothetical protein
MSRDARDLMEWTTETGVRSILGNPVFELLHLARTETAVYERSFRVRSESHLILAPVESTSDNPFMVIVRMSHLDNTAMVWRGSASGELVAAWFIDPSEGVIKLSREEQIGEFIAEKEFFRRKIREIEGP